mmetsp:Transcript_31236/g.75508  ORF Transcript_31236/g.75508 Transcript_31236/m.75508 type:complete len:488 (+) Transcript_31236:93-1556(+)
MESPSSPSTSSSTSLDLDLDAWSVSAVLLILTSFCWNSSTVLDQVSYVFMLLAPPFFVYHVMPLHDGWASADGLSDYVFRPHNNHLPWFFEGVCLATLFGYVVKLPQLFYTSIRLGGFFVLMRQLSIWNIGASQQTVELLFLDPFQLSPTMYEGLGLYFLLYATVLQPNILSSVWRYSWDSFYNTILMPYKCKLLEARSKKELEVIMMKFGSDVGLRIYRLRTSVCFIEDMEREIRNEFKTRPGQTSRSSRYDQLVANVFRYWDDLKNQPGQEYLEGVIIENVAETVFRKPSMIEMINSQGTSYVIQRHWCFIFHFWQSGYTMDGLIRHLDGQLHDIFGSGMDFEPEAICGDNRRRWEYVQRVAVIVFKCSTLYLRLTKDDDDDASSIVEKQKRGYSGLLLVLQTFIFDVRCKRLSSESTDDNEMCSYELELSAKLTTVKNAKQKGVPLARVVCSRDAKDVRTLLNKPNSATEHIHNDLAAAGWNGF